MHVVYILPWTLLLLTINKYVLCESSRTVNVKTFENETILLPCYVDDHDVRVRWYKGSSLLGDSKDPHHLLPPRIRMFANYSLHIDPLQPEDTADYTCEVIRPEPWGPIKQTHSILVQYGPTITTSPGDGFVEVAKGDYVDIGCEADGVPTPSISWKKNGEPMQLIDHRARIRFKAEHRFLSGVYECTATNGVGDPVTASIRIMVLDAPVAEAVRSFVHTAIGLRAVLAAKLEFAAPSARTHWYKDGRAVKVDDRVIHTVQNNMHQLIFRSVRASDLGNYTFRAENRLGMADVSFKLTGVPNIASFKVDQAINKATATSFRLVWEVDSYTTIIEYNLWLRPYHANHLEESYTTESFANRWSKIVVPGDASEGPIHSASYTVRGLTPSTVYEAIVTSRNRFGWSKSSAVLHFATEPGLYKKPSTSVYNESPILENLESDHQRAFNLTISGLQSSTNKSTRETFNMAAICICAVKVLVFYL